MKIALCAAALLMTSAPPVPVLDAVVVGVIDGDSLRVWVDGEVRTVHVAGIDAPNLPPPPRFAEYFGPEAARFVRDAVLSRKVRLRPDLWLPGGGSGRQMYVELPDGSDLGVELVRQGLAYALRGCERCAELRAAERKARGAFTGLWNPAAYRAFLLGRNKAVIVGMPGYGRLAEVEKAEGAPAADRRSSGRSRNGSTKTEKTEKAAPKPRRAAKPEPAGRTDRF